MCFACGGPYHPATGHLFTTDVAYCGPCIRRFYAWAFPHMKPHKKGRVVVSDFYGAAATSIRAGRMAQ